MPTFFSYPILIVVYELKRQSSLKNFAEILEIPSETQFNEYLSRYKSKITCEIANVNKKNFSNMCLSIRQIKIDDLKWIEIINLKKADEN